MVGVKVAIGDFGDAAAKLFIAIGRALVIRDQLGIEFLGGVNACDVDLIP